MRVLRQGMSGSDVERWQHFLVGTGRSIIVTGAFDPQTMVATRQFQAACCLADDGVVGPQTLASAMHSGFDPTIDDSDDEFGPNWPPPPDGWVVPSLQQRENDFGRFSYSPMPTLGNPEGIVIHGDWIAQNIINVDVPQLKSVAYATSTKVPFNKRCASQLQGVFAAWDSAGLIDRVLTWGGSFAPRFVRGSRTSLSNHAWGTAFDINVAWNMLGARPALKGQKGSVRELVGIANEHGFAWGGHYLRRPDGMHFEVLKIQ